MASGREIVLELLQGWRPPRPPVMPITMMLACDQIGRTYREYATDARVMAEAQRVTAERFGFDYVSGISDPAREAHDFGAHIQFFDNQPPAVDEADALLADKTALARLRPPDPTAGRMGDRVAALALMREAVGRSLLVEGWIEGPCAEGADLRGINTLMLDFFDDPPFVRDLFELVIANAVRFARAQVAAGADLIGIGDAAASLVGPQIYEEFVFPYEKRLIDAVRATGTRVRLHICGNTTDLLPWLGQLQADILDLDSMVGLDRARQACGPDQILLGNLDPVRVVKNGTPEQVHAGLEACWTAAGPRYIAGAGCEIPRGSPDANVRAFADWARNHG